LRAGKYFGVRPDIAMLGLDRSHGLAAAAAARPAEPPDPGGASAGRCADVAVADAMTLPIRSGACDAVLCVVPAPLTHHAWRGRVCLCVAGRAVHAGWI